MKWFTDRALAARRFLALVLFAVAVLKIFELFGSRVPSLARSAPYIVTVMAEIGAAVVLAIPHPASVVASRLVMYGFVGAGLVTMWEVFVGGQAAVPCHCLGSLRTSRALAMAMQGAIVLIAFAGSTERYSPSVSDPGGVE